MYSEECKFKFGDKVRFINEKKVDNYCYPKVGTIGIVSEDDSFAPWIQWEKGSTSQDDIWSAMETDLELVEE